MSGITTPITFNYTPVSPWPIPVSTSIPYAVGDDITSNSSGDESYTSTSGQNVILPPAYGIDADGDAQEYSYFLYTSATSPVAARRSPALVVSVG